MPAINYTKFFGSTYNIKSIITNYDRVSGWRTQLIVEGTNEALQAFIHQFRFVISDYQITGEDILKTLTININEDYQNERDIIYNWEILYNEFDESIFNHPRMQKFSDYAVQVFKAISEGRLTYNPTDKCGYIDEQKVIQYTTSTTQNIEYPNLISRFYPAPDNEQEAIQIIKLLMMGINSYLSSNIVLRRSTNLNTLSTFQFETNYYNSILSGAQLIDVFQVPEDIASSLPQKTGYEPDDKLSQFFWGFLVKGGQANFLADGKIEVSQEFWYGYWSTLLYKFVD